MHGLLRGVTDASQRMFEKLLQIITTLLSNIYCTSTRSAGKTIARSQHGILFRTLQRTSRGGPETEFAHEGGEKKNLTELSAAESCTRTAIELVARFNLSGQFGAKWCPVSVPDRW
eukprot:5293746-Pleurochrysis_carterae.AAC.1